MTRLETIEEVQAGLDSSPFQRVLGLVATGLDRDAGQVEFAVPFKQAIARQAEGRQVHGGVIASVIDIAGDYAVSVRLGHFVPTVNLRTDYLRPAVGDIRVVARVVKLGRTLGHADVEVFDSSDRQVAIGRCIFVCTRG